MDLRHIRLEARSSVATIILARPEKRNAMTEAMGDEISRVCALLRDRREIRAVVVTGEGSAFSAGGSLEFIQRMTEIPEVARREAMLRFYHRYLAILDLPMPTIAAINGHAIGAGMCFATACDLRVAAATARMGFTFAKLALHPGMGATFFLPRLVGPARAAELLYTGRVISAEEAAAIGLVNTVCPPETLQERAQTLAEEIAACGPLAVRRLKRSLHSSPAAADRSDLEDALRREATAQAADYGTPDLLEGVRAVRERRKPRFTGETTSA